jgi:hypothetical protein
MKSNNIDEYHHERLQLYLKKTKFKTMQAVIDELVKRHRKGENIAKHVSVVIGQDHEEYMMTLCKLGENSNTIR